MFFLVPKRDSIKSDIRNLEDDAKKTLPVDCENAAGRPVDKVVWFGFYSLQFEYYFNFFLIRTKQSLLGARSKES
jgi:hypothetical protein